MAGNGLTDDLVQDLLDDDPLHGDQDVLHQLRVGSCRLKTFYPPILVFVLRHEFLFYKFAKKDKSYNTFCATLSFYEWVKM